MSTSTPNSRPKRPVDIHLRSGALHPDHKRPKFDVRNPSTLAPDLEDSTNDVVNDELELDEVGIGGRRTKRNAVNIEGYESDSSNEGYERKNLETVVRGGDGGRSGGNKGKEKIGKIAEEEDEDDDMFGGGGDDDDEGGMEEGGADKEGGKLTGKDKKKGVRFLDLHEIEGQDFKSQREYDEFVDGDGGNGDGSSSESESEDEEEGGEKVQAMKDARSAEGADDDGDTDPEVGAGGKKKHAPKIDAFNMKNEMEEGRFDDAGNFVRKAKDADAVHDSWLEGVSRKDMKKAKEAHEKREKERMEKMKEDDKIMTSDVLSELIQCLERGETVLEALARLGGGKKKKWNGNKNTRWKKNANAAKMDIDIRDGEQDEEETEAETLDRKRKEMVERITGAADVLLTRGQLEIYEETREMLMRQFKRETGDDWVDPAPPNSEENGNENGEQVAEGSRWEYRWTDGRDNETYGPYTGPEMTAWNAHGFFGDGVEFKKVGASSGWTVVADFE